MQMADGSSHAIRKGPHCYEPLSPEHPAMSGTALRARVDDLRPCYNQQDHNRADDRADQACALAGPIPSEGLPQKRCNKRADDAEDRFEDETRGLVIPRA